MIVVLPNGRAMKDDRATGNIMASDKVQGIRNIRERSVERPYPIHPKKTIR